MRPIRRMVKEGFWSSHMQTIDQPGNKRIEGTTTICRSHAYDQYVKDLASKVQGCKTLSQNLQGHTFTSAMECVAGDRVIDTKETAIFQGDVAVHSETHATYTPRNVRGERNDDDRGPKVSRQLSRGIAARGT